MSEIAVAPLREKSTIWKKLVTLCQMVKFSHTVFALPIALMSAFLASEGWPPTNKLVLIILAMVGARNAAMAFNRLVDLKYDRNNPRTKNRPLVQGKLSCRQVKVFIFVCSALFIGAAYFLGRLAFLLSPFALATIFLYSYTKRFTAYSHVFLGIALGWAPIGAWVGIKDSLSLVPLALGLAIVFWVAGFDIIYACQDVQFDRQTGLHSIPQHFGTAPALWISAGFHLATIGLLLWVMSLAQLGFFYFLAWVCVTLLLAYEHYLVRPHDLSGIDTAFCMVNAMVSVVLFLGTTLDYLL